MLKIIFENFWTWAGTVVLCATILGGVKDIIAACRKPQEPGRSIRTTSYGDKTRIVEITCATRDDLRGVVQEFAGTAPIIKMESEERDGEEAGEA
ncbi:MAG: hypothetical protein NC131_10835 [Roseburia sp.]|nr:hypothetical protein [Roseburia sp.]